VIVHSIVCLLALKANTVVFPRQINGSTQVLHKNSSLYLFCKKVGEGLLCIDEKEMYGQVL
jgi:hypothetical protein